jgi:hypothetical protein
VFLCVVALVVVLAVLLVIAPAEVALLVIGVAWPEDGSDVRIGWEEDGENGCNGFSCCCDGCWVTFTNTSW